VNEYVLDDRYTLIERIATGGMGEVWRGADKILGRPVAIKMLAAVHAGDEQFRARFRAEARYASSLAHPGITRVFDYGEHSPLGGPYLVMELVDGQPLSEIIERYGRLEPYVVMDIVAQSARALDAAHRAGIVHRDIKPGNLLIMADGTTKITDFGIAKANVPDVSLTATGIVMGTALYVSPEQATGQPLSGSSDVYSLGVVAYECLAGDPPFVADQPLAIAIMHKHDPVPPLPNDVPRPVADLVYAMLAKTPQERPESAKHVADHAEVIREARNRTGYSGPVTSDLPVVPNFPDATSLDMYQNGQYPNGPGPGPGRPVPGRAPGNRTFLFTGIGAAAIGVIAIVAVLISSNMNSSSSNIGSNSTVATQSASPASSKARPSLTPTTTQPVSNFVPGNAGTNVVPTTSVSASKTSPVTKSPSKSPTATASKSASSSPSVTTSTSTSTAASTPPSSPTPPSGSVSSSASTPASSSATPTSGT
jgi:serine/threonine protein kinase